MSKSTTMKEKNTSQLQALASSDQLQKSETIKGNGSSQQLTKQVGGAQTTNTKKAVKPKKNVAAKIFEGVIMTLIIISSITLVIDNPL